MSPDKNPEARTTAAQDALQEALRPRESEDFRSQSASLFEGFRGALALHPYFARRSGPRWAPRFLRGWRAAAGLILGTGIGCAAIAAIAVLGNSRVTWADVVERFKTVKSFSATVYRKEDATSEPQQFELWVGEEGRLRVRVGKQVAFGAKGHLTTAFDLETRAKTTVDRMAEALVEVLGQSGEFSFDTLVRSLTGELSDITPLVNADAVISEDLVVFDIASDRTPEWMRIWALRESRLPVQVRVWDPREGECTDVFFSYSKDQPAEFYDPEAFASAISKPSERPGELAYALLEDPVGQNTARPKADEAAAFDVVTTTLDGEPWRMADQRGKAVFLYFWTVDYPAPPDEYVYDLYKKFGERDDFVMAGVPLGGDVEKVKTVCDQWNMRWLQLYEPGKAMRQNSLVKALGVVNTERGVLIWKDGYIDEVYDGSLAGRVEGAVVGVTFDSCVWISQRLQRLWSQRDTIDKAFLEGLCGPPDSIEKVEPGTMGQVREQWNYVRINDEGTRKNRLYMGFDADGKPTTFRSNNLLVDPATIEVYIGPEFWKREIESNLDPDILEGLGTKYELLISGGRPSATPCTLEEARAGHTWSGTLPFGRRRISFTVYDIENQRYGFERVPFDETVELARNEKKTLRFE